MKALITGITGFVGSHLAEYLLNKNIEVWGTYRWRSKLDNIKDILNKIILVECDITDSNSVENIIKSVKPNIVFHLAAQSFVPTSWQAPKATMDANIIGTLNIFEAIKRVNKNIKIQLACSSEEYGMVLTNEVPIKETNPLRPLSPYGVSKVAADMLGYQYNQSHGLYIIRTRAFNHTGPRRGDVFVTSNFAKQIAQIEKGLQPPVIKVGNLSSIRDFTDVRDIVKAYLLAIENCEPGEVYNISSDVGYKIKDVLNILLSFSKLEIKIESDINRWRPSDVQVLIGDSTKFRKKTGWRPEHKLEKTLKDILDYWRIQN